MNDWVWIIGLWLFMSVMTMFSVISVSFLVFFILFDIALRSVVESSK